MSTPSKTSIVKRLLKDVAEEHEIRTVLKPRGAVAMLGFAKRFRTTRTTEEWMTELRGPDLKSEE
jgi:hypothetical protein